MKKTLFAIAFTAAMLLAPSAFAAGECDTDTDCESYETCEVIGEATCACAPGDAGCDCPDSGTEEYRECVAEPPESCDSDADCSSDLECYTQTYEQCSGGGSVGTCEVSPDGGTTCEDAGTTDVSESCETITEGYCVPSYVAPCETDTDCGTGFTCEEYEVCECSGGDSGGVDAGTSDDSGTTDSDTTDTGDQDSGSSCTCETAGKSCELIETECTSDDDCSGDLTCQSYDDGDTSTEPCVDDGDTSSCTSTDAGSSTSTMYCLPPDWERWEAVAGDLDQGGADGSAEETGGDAGLDAGADTGSSAPNADDQGSNSEGGCSSTGQQAPIGSLALMLLGLLGLAARRRQS